MNEVVRQKPTYWHGLATGLFIATVIGFISAGIIGDINTQLGKDRISYAKSINSYDELMEFILHNLDSMSSLNQLNIEALKSMKDRIINIRDLQ